jgi:hypothetical protein
MSIFAVVSKSLIFLSNSRKKLKHLSEIKGQKKRKTGPKYPCGVCKRECEDNVLGCDGCDSWFHADCLKIEDLDELPDKWFCNECGNI